MAVRNLLHKSKLNAFEAWLNSKGYETAEPKSYWEVLRAKKGNRTVIVYRKANATEHYTLMDRDYHMYRQFLKDTSNMDEGASE